jgi:hypothetical protein
MYQKVVIKAYIYFLYSMLNDSILFYSDLDPEMIEREYFSSKNGFHKVSILTVNYICQYA